MTKIVISYRRDDSPGMTGWIHEKLAARFGEKSVFRDIDAIEPGTNFEKAIGRALHHCDVLLAVIGKKWLGEIADGRRRIDEEHDWVRVEVETAIKLGIPVIPVLVDKAVMPTAADLPQHLKELAVYQGVAIDSGPDFYQQVERLADSIVRFVPASAPAPAPASREPESADTRAAPDTAVPPTPEPFRVGKVLSVSSTVFPRLLFVFFIVTLVEWLPSLLTINSKPDGGVADVRHLFESVFLSLILNSVSQAVVVCGVLQYLQKQPTSLQKALEAVIRRIGSILAIGLITAVLLCVGLVLLIVPALIILTFILVAIPACQIERLGPLHSINRSAKLTKGVRWKILSLILLTDGVQVAVDQCLKLLNSASGGAIEAVLAMLVWNTVWGLFAAIVIAVTYFELRREKEGIEVAQIASVFD